MQTIRMGKGARTCTCKDAHFVKLHFCMPYALLMAATRRCPSSADAEVKERVFRIRRTLVGRETCTKRQGLQQKRICLWFGIGIGDGVLGVSLFKD